jgi:prenyltransferase beta subunit
LDTNSRATPHLAAVEASIRFVQSHQTPQGGFRGREDKPDLYYTVFAVEALQAMGGTFDQDALGDWLVEQGFGAELDFIHACCLARIWADLNQPEKCPAFRDALADRLAAHRTADGLYGPDSGAAQGSAFATFFAVSTWQDLALPTPEPERLVAALLALATEEGGFANETDSVATTPSTVAAVLSLRALGAAVPAGAPDWLRARVGEDGGVRAAEFVPIGDLLSTATALHTLQLLDRPLPTETAVRCEQFVRGCQDADGGFHGSMADDTSDCEYLFYGMMALGALAAQGACS